jgi:ribonuclease HI
MNGKPVRNKDLWEELLIQAEHHAVSWSWVEGHAGNIYNERAHRWQPRPARR